MLQLATLATIQAMDQRVNQDQGGGMRGILAAAAHAPPVIDHDAAPRAWCLQAA